MSTWARGPKEVASRTRALTDYPRSTSSGMSDRPTKPLAPVTAARPPRPGGGGACRPGGSSPPRPEPVASGGRGGVVDAVEPARGQVHRPRAVGVSPGRACRVGGERESRIEPVEQPVHPAEGAGLGQRPADRRSHRKPGQVPAGVLAVLADPEVLAESVAQEF